MEEIKVSESPSTLTPNNKTDECKKNIDAISEDKSPAELLKDNRLYALAANEIFVDRIPKSGCRHCYGTGKAGRYINNQQIVPCRCMYNRFSSIRGTKIIFNIQDGSIKVLPSQT